MSLQTEDDQLYGQHAKVMDDVRRLISNMHFTPTLFRAKRLQSGRPRDFVLCCPPHRQDDRLRSFSKPRGASILRGSKLPLLTTEDSSLHIVWNSSLLFCDSK